MALQKAYIVWILISMIYGQVLQTDLNGANQPQTIQKPIKQILVDSFANYIILYSDQTIAAYDSSFRFLRTAKLSQPVETIEFIPIQSAQMLLGNGSALSFTSLDLVATYSANHSRVSYLNSSDFSILTTFNAGQRIINQRAAVLFNSSLAIRQIAVILICDSAIRTGKNGQLQIYYSYNQYKAGLLASCTLATGYTWTSGTGFVSLMEKYEFSMTDTRIYYITMSLQMNYQLGSIILNSFSSNFTYQIKFPQTIQRYLLMDPSSKVYIMQSANYSTYMIQTNSSALGTVSPSLSGRKILQMFYLYGHYFLLFNDSITQIIFTQSTYSLTAGPSIPLSPAVHQVVINQLVTFSYDVGSSRLTKLSPANCSGSQSVYNSSNGSCSNYTCTDRNCQSCKWSQNSCDECSSGFKLDAQLVCQLKDSPLNLISQLLNSIIGVLGVSATVPGGRSLATPLFYFFGNFDSIYFYRFHDREYGPTMSWFLGNISQIEDEKWKVIDLKDIIGEKSLNSSLIEGYFKVQGLKFYNYSTFNHPEADDSQGFLENNFSFLSQNIPCLFFLFIGLKIVFRLIYKYPVSRLLRTYSLWGTFMIVCFEGNIQQFAFYLTQDIFYMFVYEYLQKYGKILILLFSFVVLIVSCGGLLICKAFYERLNFYLCDNVRNNISGVGLQSLSFGWSPFLMGLLNSLLRFVPYQHQNISLLLVEIILCLISVHGLNGCQHRSKLKVWIGLQLTLLRIILLLSLYYDYQQTGQIVFESIQQTAIFLMIILFLVGFINESLLIFAQLFHHFRKFINRFCRKEVNQSGFQIKISEVGGLIQINRKSSLKKNKKNKKVNEYSRFYQGNSNEQKKFRLTSKVSQLITNSKQQKHAPFRNIILKQQKLTIKYV